eukprot:1158208-Pelagomonas_calceolata.AAC.50
MDMSKCHKQQPAHVAQAVLAWGACLGRGLLALIVAVQAGHPAVAQDVFCATNNHTRRDKDSFCQRMKKRA